MVKELELKINRTDANTAQYEKRTEATAHVVSALRVGLKSMYDKLGCDNESNRELLGDEGVTDSNMLTYLGVVEQRAGEVMQMYAAASTGHDQTAIREMLGSTGPLTPGKFGSTMTIVPPSTAAEERDGSESEEEIDDRPLTREELQAKTMRRLNKRESRGASATQAKVSERPRRPRHREDVQSERLRVARPFFTRPAAGFNPAPEVARRGSSPHATHETPLQAMKKTIATAMTPTPKIVHVSLAFAHHARLRILAAVRRNVPAVVRKLSLLARTSSSFSPRSTTRAMLSTIFRRTSRILSWTSRMAVAVALGSEVACLRLGAEARMRLAKTAYSRVGAGPLGRACVRRTRRETRATTRRLAARDRRGRGGRRSRRRRRADGVGGARGSLEVEPRSGRRLVRSAGGWRPPGGWRPARVGGTRTRVITARLPPSRGI